MKLIVKALSGRGVLGGVGYAICDRETGEPLPKQRSCRIEQRFKEPVVVTVEFLVNGDTVAIEPSAPADRGDAPGIGQVEPGADR